MVVAKAQGKGEIVNYSSVGIGFSYVRWINSRDLLYNIIPTVNNNISYTKNLLGG